MISVENLPSHPFPSRPARVIQVAGNEREIGRQHAEAVGDECRRGMPLFYYEFWRRLLEPHVGGWRSQVFRAGTMLLDPLLVSRLQARIPAPFEARMQGLCEASGIPYRQLATAMVLPDMMPYLQAFLTKVRPYQFPAPAMAPHFGAPSVPRFGCTSFVASGKSFLHGRNLDFPGVSYWDRYPVIQCTRVNGAIPYIAITSAGVPVGGITGINAERVSVSLHQHYASATSLEGSSPIVIAEEILKTARDLNAALDLLRGSKVATSWAFIVADGKKKDAFLYECDARHAGVRWLSKEGRPLAHSNFFQCGECRESEYSTSARMTWDNHARRDRLRALVEAGGSTLTAENAVPLLGDHFDPYLRREKVINRTVSQLYNIQSLVIDFDKMTCWLAEGDSPIHLGDYHEYDLAAAFDGKSCKTGNNIPGYRFRDEAVSDAKRLYTRSFIYAFAGQSEEALSLARQALERAFEPEMAQVTAVLCLQRGKLDEARELLSRAVEAVQTASREVSAPRLPPEYFELALFLARTLDLANKASEARALYREIAEHPDLEDSNLRRLASRARPYQVRDLRKLVMPYSSYIPFE